AVRGTGDRRCRRISRLAPGPGARGPRAGERDTGEALDEPAARWCPVPGARARAPVHGVGADGPPLPPRVLQPPACASRRAGRPRAVRPTAPPATPPPPLDARRA